MSIEKIRKMVLAGLNGRDPFHDPHSWDLCEKKLPKSTWNYLTDPTGIAKFWPDSRKFSRLICLSKIWKHKFVGKESEIFTETRGDFTRPSQSITCFMVIFMMHKKLLVRRVKKGTPLVWMSDCYTAMGCPGIAKRCLMLALCENAIHNKGKVPPDTTGTYWRLVFRHGIEDKLIKKYGKKAFIVFKAQWLRFHVCRIRTEEFDKEWMVELPAPNEAGIYFSNTRYIQYLTDKLGDSKGQILERLADYILSCMPGCRTAQRQRSFSTDYDIVCSMDGFNVDFRSEFGRYFVCECKDWKKPADFSTIAKFCRILDSIKCRFGILFSKKGISGKGKTLNAERELLKVFQDQRYGYCCY